MWWLVEPMGDDDVMIVAVEGLSAAGKTTWCRRHAVDFVAEYVPTGTEPDGTDLAAQAAYWVAIDSQRWDNARRLEQQTGLAVCDSDPLKLHYSWCLSRIGAAPPERFEHELAQVRRAFAAGTLGLADLVLVSIPSLETLQRQRNADPTRRRRHFDLHSQLGEHLQTWYAGVDALDPGRVIWQLPAEGLPADVPQPRDQRSDLALLDALTAWLPPA